MPGLPGCSAHSRRDSLPAILSTGFPREKTVWMTRAVNRVTETANHDRVRLREAAYLTGSPSRGGVQIERGGNVNRYELVANRMGTNEARALAAELLRWHDAMVIHLRSSGSRHASDCEDNCPHDEAPALWSAACEIFGDDADELQFLRKFGARTNHGDEVRSLVLGA
jgi:hypothetical protein